MRCEGKSDHTPVFAFRPPVAAPYLGDKISEVGDEEFSVSAVSFEGEDIVNCKEAPGC
jgi:hypothetical protein